MYEKHVFMKVSIALAVVLSVVLMVGCTDKRSPKGPTGTVSGSVKYKGKPVTVGFVVFQELTTKKGGTATLNTEGKYTIPIPIEIGEYNVGFPSPEPPPPHEDTKPAASPLPSKYHVPEQGTVKFTVVAGANTADFDLD